MTPAEARVRQGFAAQPFMTSIGATLVRIDAGEVEIQLPCAPALMQHTGVVHAGAVTAVVDSACGFAAATLMPTDREVVSVEFKLNLIAPAIGDHLTAIGRVARQGRTLTVCTGEVWAVSGLTRQLVAIMQATMMAVTRRSDRAEGDGEVSLA